MHNELYEQEQPEEEWMGERGKTNRKEHYEKEDRREDQKEQENEEAEDVKHPNRSKVEVFISMNPSSSSSSSLKTEILLPLFLSWETWSQEYISIEDAAMLNKWSNLFRSKLTPDP